MDLDWSEADAAFRDEVVAFLDEKLTPDLRAGGPPHDERLLRARGEHGVAAHPARAWLGGAGLGRRARRLRLESDPALHLQPRVRSWRARRRCRPWVSGWCPMPSPRSAPRSRKTSSCRASSTGEVFFCQGYSEPEAGSDLASLTMAAVDEGDDLVCTGSKIWTTHAAEANWMFCLVRTSQAREEAAGHHVPADRHDIAGYRGSGRW